MSKVIGYNVYTAPEGSSETYHGFARSKRAARRLASAGGLPESLYGTARAAGHVCGTQAPDKSREASEPCEWFGRGGWSCLVPVYSDN